MAILLVFPAIILGVHLCLLAGVLVNRARDARARRLSGAPVPAISVIVVARDEEHYLPGLLESLSRQTVSGFELILVNDRSTDRTPAIMEEFSRREQLVTVIHNSVHFQKLTNKQALLDQAVSAARGEILFFTDADCRVPPQWIERHLPYFQDPRVGIVFGQISLPPGRRFLTRYQAFDQPLIHQYSSGSAGLGVPTGCFGNNLVARRAALDEIGGFASLGYTVTEDAALISAVGRAWKVVASCIRESMIETYPKSDWKSFINQHVRWNSGGFYSSDPATRLGYRFIVLYLVASVLVAPLSFFQPFLLVFPAVAFISIALPALVPGLFYCRGRQRLVYFLRFIPYTLFFMAFYSLVTVLSMLKISLEWKGARLKTG